MTAGSQHQISTAKALVQLRHDLPGAGDGARCGARGALCASGLPGLTASSAVGRFPCGASSAGPIDALTSSHRLRGHKSLEAGVSGKLVPIEGLKQRAEVWQTPVARLQCRRRAGSHVRGLVEELALLGTLSRT